MTKTDCIRKDVRYITLILDVSSILLDVSSILLDVSSILYFLRAPTPPPPPIGCAGVEYAPGFSVLEALVL